MHSIIVFHSEAREELIDEGVLKEKVCVIPQSTIPVDLEDEKNREISLDSVHEKCVTFLFAAGIRKVKAPLEMIEMMTLLRESQKNIKLIIIGPILDKELGEKINQTLANKEWAKYMGEVSHKDTQEFILESDIVLNTSVSEGMSSTLLEAQQMGKPILATDIAGNRAIVTHGVDGFLFKDKEEFQYYAKKLVNDISLREEMSLESLNASKKYGLEQEISNYERVYKSKE